MSGHVHVDLGEELGSRFNKIIPPGTKSSIMRALVEALVIEAEKNGPGIIGVVLDNAFNLRKHLLGESNGKTS